MNTEIVSDLAGLAKDPLSFVYWAFPWGEGLLTHQDGPEAWQKEILGHIGENVSTDKVIQEAVASGHGIGKSALVSWLILWAISTHENTRGVVTANTETQLLTKTWPELMKWHAMFLARDLFKVTATSIFAAEDGKEKNWRIDAIPWSVANPEAFAGLHNQGNRTILIFDEASAIDDKIWEVAEGALNDANTERLWCAFGNPTRNTGRFYDCFHKFRPYWHTMQVDSRSVRFSDKTKISQWEEAYGADSDFFKVRVTGDFPDASDLQFIPLGLVKKAAQRNLHEGQYKFAPCVIGVDPAWSGGDATSIYLRQGLYTKKLARILKNTNDMTIANMYSAGTTMGRAWNLISFAGSSPDPSCVNMRAYMWLAMKKWFQTGGVIEADQTLIDDLTHVEIKPTMDGRIQLRSKDEMKKEGIPSPNDADALALTFAVPVVNRKRNGKANTNYQLF